MNRALGQPDVEELEQALQRLLHGAPTLRHACRSLLDFVSSRLAIRRALILVRQGDRLEGVENGVASGVLEELLRAEREEEANARALGALEGRGPLLSGPGALPGELGLFQPLALEDAELRFAGTLWVPRDIESDRIALCREILDRSTHALAGRAEADGLRRALDHSRDRAVHFRKAFDSLPDPVLVMDGASHLILTNPRADELLIAGPQDSSGRRRAVETNNLYFSAFRAKVFLGGDESRELFLVDPADGSDLLFEVGVLEISSPGGPDEGHIYILRDITDLKRATAELEAEYGRAVAAEHRTRRESERLHVILANAGVPILVTDEQNDIVLMNLEAESLFETPPSVRPGSPDLRNVRSNDAKISGLISDFLLQADKRREDEVDLVEPSSGRGFPSRVILTKLLNRRGEPTAVVCALHDLTEEREVQRLADQLQDLNRDLEARIEEATLELSRRNRELEEQRGELVRASRMKTEFLAMMSHELRTPINSILGFNSLLREGILGDLSPKQIQALEKMHTASDHLLSLINDILDLSKVEAGKLSLAIEALPVWPFMASLGETIRPMAESKGLEFALEVLPDGATVRADSTRLRQVILNLASNALKFTPEGRIVLRALQVDDPPRIRFEVEDTGVGIQEAELEQIFEEFRQGGQFATREHGGTGLGLAISRKLISLMEGRLSVRSVPGEGSVFWLELPVGDGTRSRARPDEGASTSLGARAPDRNPSHSHPAPPRR